MGALRQISEAGVTIPLCHSGKDAALSVHKLQSGSQSSSIEGEFSLWKRSGRVQKRVWAAPYTAHEHTHSTSSLPGVHSQHMVIKHQRFTLPLWMLSLYACRCLYMLEPARQAACMASSGQILSAATTVAHRVSGSREAPDGRAWALAGSHDAVAGSGRGGGQGGEGGRGARSLRCAEAGAVALERGHHRCILRRLHPPLQPGEQPPSALAMQQRFLWLTPSP